jgi:molybdopterin molybdotransferase
MRGADWLEIDEALHTILENIATVGAETVPLDAVLGRTLAEPVLSPIDHPPWDNSGMDGFAVHADDVRGATAAAPVELRIIEDIRAGDLPTRAVARGEAARIMTGAPIPAGADTVVRVEHTRTRDDHVIVVNDADARRNVRARGEDVRAGSLVFENGTLLGPGQIGVLAMLGVAAPRVSLRPRVAVLATGNELVEVDRLQDVLAGTHIINSNTPALTAALRATACEPLSLGIARDDMDDLIARLLRADDADALITTAGASVGEHDLVKDAIERLGCRTLFWRVKIRPGSPFSFGLIARAGRPDLPVFGLPGNPVSALVTFEILVRPALRRMQGRDRIHPRTIRAVAGESIRSPTGLVRFLRVRLDAGADGIDRAFLTGPQGSGILTSIAAADGLAVLPLDVEVVPEGGVVTVVMLGDDVGVAHRIDVRTCFPFSPLAHAHTKPPRAEA